MGFFENILASADAHSAAIQAVATIVVVVITAFALVWNRQMASVMQKTYELSARPYAGVDSHMGKSEGPDWVELQYKIVNLGSVPIVCRVESASFRGELTSSKKGGDVVLYPKQSMEHRARYEVPPSKAADVRGEAEIRMVYWALGVPAKSYYHRRVIEVQPFSDYTIVKDEAGEVS